MDWRLIKRSFTSSLDEEDRRVLEAWLDESERHRQLYEEMKRFVVRRENFQLSMEMKKQFKQEFDLKIDEAYRRRGRRVWLKVVSYAAMLALPLIAGILLWTRQPVEEVVDYGIGPIEHGVRKATLVLNDGKVLALDTSRMTLKESDGVMIHTNDQALVYVDSLDNKGVDLQNRLITPKGGEYTIMLVDGTKVWVNAATEIYYPVKFVGKERRVWLEGEAYFDVAKDAERPFVVCVNGVDVTALGTEFNIAAVQGGDEVLTTLVNGSVRVVNEEGADCILTPAEQAVCKKGVVGIEVQKVNTNLYTSWKDGYYAFDKQPLGEIMRTLERWYDIHVVFADSVAGKLRFSGRLKRYEDIDNLLTMIKLTNDVDFEIAERVIIVRTNKNRK